MYLCLFISLFVLHNGVAAYLAFTTLSPVNAPFHSWYICDHTEYKTRIGPNYKVYKHKAPSATPMYTPFAVEVIRFVYFIVFAVFYLLGSMFFLNVYI